MLKKALILLTLLMPTALWAQYNLGFWTLHPTFVAEQAQNCIDTGDKVFYLVSGCLYCLDKETLENETYTKQNYLSDVKSIDGIYYNYKKRYLAIVYDNSNIDFITSEGRIVNLPEIKDAILTSSKSVTDITFTDGDLMYVSTDFGYIVVDDSRFVIKESHVYHKAISSIAQVGQKLVASIGDTIYVSPIDTQHDVLSSFVPTTLKFADAHLYPINGSRLFFYNASMFYVGTLGGTADKPKVTLSGNNLGMACNGVQHTPTGFMANFMKRGYYYTFDTNGTNATKVEGGNEIYTISPSGGTMWALGASGLHKSGETSNYYKPNAISITTIPFWASYEPQQGLFYLQTTGDNFMLTRTADNNVMEINTYDGQTWRNATPDKLGTTATQYSGYRMVFNPRDPRTYFFSTRDRGIYKVTNGKTADIYYQGTNHEYQPTPNYPGVRYRGATAFDSDGNLWVVASGYDPTSERSNVVVLPSANVNSTTPVTTSDWKKVTVPNINSGEFKRASFLISDNIKIYNDGSYTRPFFVWRDGMNTANPTVRTLQNFTDQDGKSITWTYIRSMSVDLNGHIWIGVEGVIEFDPHDVFSDNFRVNHVKVPRNDGTGLADYLLEGSAVNCIAVDAQNRKWIGTTTGLYQVSADGTQVLREFNTSNSMLPHDNVFDVACNTRDNTVYIVTGGGVVEYNDTGASSATDLSNVYCYPNPVRPDFTGLLTITGLPTNTLVKIADSAGNVIKQVRSSGGIATWDCCGSDGNRVATGVYYVLASTSESGSSNNIVAKFLVVK